MKALQKTRRKKSSVLLLVKAVQCESAQDFGRTVRRRVFCRRHFARARRRVWSDFELKKKMYETSGSGLFDGPGGRGSDDAMLPVIR
jgi:hypothetical protein